MGLRAEAQPSPGDRGPKPDRPEQKRGLVLNTPKALPGYTLFAPLNSTKTYLVDLDGKLVHTWRSKYVPGQAVYLLDDGSILRCAREPRNKSFGGGGIGGRVQRIAADGKLLWDYAYANEQHCQHHDIEPLPGGNILLIAWEKKSRDEAIKAGRDPDAMRGDELWPDYVIEVAPDGATGGKVVWGWHLWDHLVQEFDDSKANYGAVAEHPELINVNFDPHGPRESREDMDKLRSLGYVGGREPDDGPGDRDAGPPDGPGRGPGGFDRHADWCHTNSVDYNAEFDQIALSVHNFNEVWIIDHSTTTKEAAGHRGGRYGKGGDLLYRWGNPRAFGAGDGDDQKLFAQHDARWIEKGLPGAGHLTVFNNGEGRPDGDYSSIVEIALPNTPKGDYRLERDKAFEPTQPYWEYTAPDKSDFFASHISGAQRLQNGNTLICNGEEGRIFEVSPAGKIVWDYLNPYLEREGPEDGFGPPRDRPGGRRFRDRDGDGDHGPPQVQKGDRKDDRRPRNDSRGRRRWGPGHGPPGGPGGPGGGLFRATRIAMNHPGLKAILNAAPPK